MYGVISGKTRKIKKAYGSIGSTTRKIKKIYSVINGVTRLVFSSGFSFNEKLYFIKDGNKYTNEYGLELLYYGTYVDFYGSIPCLNFNQRAIAFPTVEGNMDWIYGKTIYMKIVSVVDVNDQPFSCSGEYYNNASGMYISSGSYNSQGYPSYWNLYLPINCPVDKVNSHYMSGVVQIYSSYSICVIMQLRNF